jgi:hypothetical protein
MKKINFPIVEPFSFTADSLRSNEFLEGGSTTVKDKKKITFSCDLDDMKDGVLRMGQGFMKTSGAWIEISKNKVCAYSYFSYTNPNQNEILEPTKLGFNIDGFISVIINNDYANGNNFVIITSSTGSIKIPVPKFSPNSGEMFVSPLNFDITNCKFSWICECYACDIWIYGDSYLGFGHGARWPYYMLEWGFSSWMSDSKPGGNSNEGYESISNDVTIGKPVYLLWAFGMNDGTDISNTQPNYNWQNKCRNVISICTKLGIIPILATIPSVPNINHEGKNYFVRNSGLRYIDFAAAVGATSAGVWKTGMLAGDNVHPTQLGAKALASQVLIDFPEIMLK